MAPRTVHWLTLVLVLAGAAVGLLLAGWLMAVAGLAPPFALAIALALIGLAAIASWLIQDFAWLQPLEQLERGLRLQLDADPTRCLVAPVRHGLGTLPARLEVVSRRLSEAASALEAPPTPTRRRRAALDPQEGVPPARGCRPDRG